jgi:flagellar biosynthetic protein FliR
MLATFLSLQAFGLTVVLARVGAALMVLPGIGDSYVSPRVRLMLAFAIALVLLPVLGAGLPAMPQSPLMLAALIAGEVIVGLFIGLTARLLLIAVDVAGMIVSFQLSLANAAIFNPGVAQQSSLVGTFLTTLALVLIFAADLHHAMLGAIVDSYAVMPVGRLPQAGDLALAMTRLVGTSFSIGVRIAAPFLVVGIIFQLGLGLLARLMPQVQIFFIAVPMQVMLGLVVAAITLSAGMLLWLGAFAEGLALVPAG